MYIKQALLELKVVLSLFLALFLFKSERTRQALLVRICVIPGQEYVSDNFQCGWISASEG